MISTKRKRKTNLKIKQRLEQIKKLGFLDDKCLKQPHRLAKRPAFGCSRSKCISCHEDKYDDKISETEIIE